jgi:hypothetical protein
MGQIRPKIRGFRGVGSSGRWWRWRTKEMADAGRGWCQVWPVVRIEGEAPKEPLITDKAGTVKGRADGEKDGRSAMRERLKRAEGGKQKRQQWTVDSERSNRR